MASYRAYVTPDVTNVLSPPDPTATDYQATSFYPYDVGNVNPAPEGMMYGPGGAPIIFGATPGQWVDTIDSSTWFPWLAGGLLGFLLARFVE